MKRRFWLVIAAIGFLTASSAYAGGPFWVNRVKDLGDAQHWGGNTLEWWIEPEGNDLSTTVNNATAKEWISAAFAKWADAGLLDKDRVLVKTVGFTAAFGGHTDEGIDETNYETYYNNNPGKIVIVFDKNGMITKDMAGENYLYIPGLTELLLSDEDGKVLLKGIVILNGLLLSGGEISLTKEQFQAAIQHELGHLINLDHTQVNLDVADNCTLTPGTNIDVANCPDAQYIPTMFPALKTYRQGAELKTDDISTISWIYSSAAFGSSFCTITGEIQDMNGRPMQGINVIAKRVSSDESFVKADSRSMVSGVMYTACNEDGHYYLHGIVPGRTYDVVYEPLDSSYTGMSGFEPLGSPPVGFEPGTIGQAKCDNGGETVEMEAVKIESVNFDTYCPPDSGDGDVSDSGGKGCSLIIPK